MNLKEKIKSLPSCPEIYLMKDAAGSVFYVGKSKNLPDIEIRGESDNNDGNIYFGFPASTSALSPIKKKL